jgi:hypothetical protein
MCVASNPVYLVRCLFLLYSLLLCVAYAAEASFDKKGLLEAVHDLKNANTKQPITKQDVSELSLLADLKYSEEL